MKVYLESLGCAKNLVDSEMMLGRVKGAGLEVCRTPEQAEIIIVNTCSFIESAADESIDTILELAKQKKTGRCRRLIVTGCLPQRYGEDIAAALSEVDLFLGTGAFDQIVSAVTGGIPETGCWLPDPNRVPLPQPDTPRDRAVAHSAYLKIAEGCDRYCTYCIIPKLRGRQRSRPVADLLREAQSLMEAGVREIILVAQETTAYGKDMAPPTDLKALLQELVRLGRQYQPPGVSNVGEEPIPPMRPDPPIWFRLLYGHPASMNEDLIQTVARHASICDYFDIPVQHASDSILKKMGRQYTRQDLVDLVAKIRKLAPRASLRTTVIVGFPGETESDFNQLVDFVESVQFDHLGVFTYSDSEDLASHGLAAPVAAVDAERRRHHLMSRQADISAARNARYIGKSVQVLVEEAPEPGLYMGRTAFQAPEVDGLTFITADNLTIGSFAQVRITDATVYDLAGEPLHG